jgi:hypothetical protein
LNRVSCIELPACPVFFEFTSLIEPTGDKVKKLSEAIFLDYTPEPKELADNSLTKRRTGISIQDSIAEKDKEGAKP